jgi:hypothetical protein
MTNCELQWLCAKDNALLHEYEPPVVKYTLSQVGNVLKTKTNKQTEMAKLRIFHMIMTACVYHVILKACSLAGVYHVIMTALVWQVCTK